MDTKVNTFIDKKGRTIIVGYDAENIVAEHNGVEIARWTFDLSIEDKTLLGVVSMEKEYERAGIGMMKAAEEQHNDFLVVKHFSSEGAAFFRKCHENKISKFSHEEVVEDDRY